MSRRVIVHGERQGLMALEIADHEDPWFAISLLHGIDQGLVTARIKPGEGFWLFTRPLAWITIVDDRAPGAEGPSSFDRSALRWLFAEATNIAVDASEPNDPFANVDVIEVNATGGHVALYEYFVKEGLKGRRILVIRTIESRLEVWREFSRQNCGLYGIAEVVPVNGDPKRVFSASVRRFEGRPAPRS
jgi:hypothetical protein